MAVVHMSEKQKRLIKIYASCAKSVNKHPTRKDLLKKGISRDSLRTAFGDMESLKAAAIQAHPESFSKIIDTSYFNDQVFDALQKQIKQHKRFIVTTAVGGAPIHKGFMSAIKTYCKQNDALLLIIPANYALYDLDPEIVQNEHIVFKGIKLNSSISISPVKIDSKQVDPTVGLDLVGQREGTLLIGSPKQRRRPVANSSSKLAHILQATGAITIPKYIPKDGTPKRRDFLAEQQHKVGAVVVEIADDKLYHFRQIEANKDGSFNDIFSNYSSSGVKPAECEAVVQGDYHNLETDPQADSAADELCALGKPTYRIFHDLFDGKSINHHERKNKVNRAIDAKTNKLSLENELAKLKDTVEAKLALNTASFLVVSKSNHDEFLDRYLAEGDFDDQNRVISTKLQILAMEGKDPLKAGLEEIFGLKKTNKVKWLNRDEDFRISKSKIEAGCHGDLGANGKRNPGSVGMLKAYGDCIYGHCHYGEINHGAMSVGTTSYLKQRYNRGASSWTHTHGIVYKDGTRQLINVINGQWHLTT